MFKKHKFSIWLHGSLDIENRMFLAREIVKKPSKNQTVLESAGYNAIAWGLTTLF
jgi:hypothetical protein